MSHIILGASGHVGSAVAEALLRRGERVTVVLRDPDKAAGWQQKGAQVALADVHDVEALRGVICQGKRLFLLNPPAPPSSDTDSEERKTLNCILEALDGLKLEKVVALSTYGAQPGEHIADSGVLYEMEQALKKSPLPVSIIRGAYYMSNWDAALKTAQKEGKIHTLYPTDFKMPMVAPQDIGQVAAHLMMEPVDSVGLHHVEGPEMYSADDVAAMFSAALGKPVEAVGTPREQWNTALKAMGFSDEAAQSFEAMSALTLKAKFPVTENPTHGTTSLSEYIEQLLERQGAS